MEAWLQYFTPHTHVTYTPFRDTDSNGTAKEVPTLQESCRSSILKYLTLRRLASCIDQLGLPKLLCRSLKSLNTKDFDLKEHAPFRDFCGMTFLHRALTYRVRSRLDGKKYLVTHAFWVADTQNSKEYSSGWSGIQHPNIMSVYGLVEDSATGNFFYLFDFPRMSLDRLKYATEERNIKVPELFLWRLVGDLGSALEYLLCFSLRYQNCDLSNVFVVDDRLALENGLTRKVWDSSFGVETDDVESKVVYDPEKEAVSHLRKMVQDMIQSREWLYSKSFDSLLEHMKRNNSLSTTLDLVQVKLNNPNDVTFSMARFLRDLQKTNDIDFQISEN